MGKNFLTITDTVQFSLLNPSLVQIKDDYEGAFKPEVPGRLHSSGMGNVGVQEGTQQTSKGLLVSIAATHSGIITRNNGYYLPNKMREGTKTFVEDFAKPILLHHEQEKDAVGRVVESKYQDTSGAIVDQYDGVEVKARDGRVIGSISETMIQDFNSGNMPMGQSLDIVCRLFNVSDGILEDNQYAGLGYIELLANVVDPDAIQKLLDGRYLTGSVGVSTDAAICSVCRLDWTKEGKCEHQPGAIYDSVKCFMITGNLKYSEYSFVNKPADRHSRAIKLHYNGITDSVETADSFGRVYEVSLGFPQYDNAKKEEELMALQDIQKSDEKTPATDKVTTEVEVSDSVNTDDSSQVADTTTEGGDTEVQDGDTTTATEGNTDTSSEVSFEDFIVQVLDGEVEPTDEQHEQLYEALYKELVNAVNDGEVVLTAEELADAKLSTEKRKSLTKSQFCGPNRSFPVNDCAHVTAAHRLINRAKISDSTKDKVMACVSRKEKALGCKKPESRKDAAIEDSSKSYLMHQLLNIIETVEYDCDDKKNITEDEMSTLRAMLKRLAGIVGKDSVREAALSEGLVRDEQDLLDEIVQNEETIGELRERLDAVQQEYNDLYTDVGNLQDQLIEVRKSARSSKEQHLSLLTTLRDSKVEKRDWTTLEDSVLDTEISQIAELVDMVKITDKLGNGMTQEPQEKVENPVEISDNTSNEITVTDLAQIQERHTYLLFRHGSSVAQAFLDQMKREGKLPQEG